MLAFFFLAGCNRSDPKAPVAEVRLGYFPNFTHAQAVLGIESGEFAAAVGPATIKPKVFNAGPSLVEALFAGEIDVGYVGPGPALNAFVKSRGQSIRVISGAAADGVVIVAGPKSGIESLKDLKGKTLATPQYGNTQDISARHYLQAELGVSDLSNVKPISNAEQWGLMADGKIDAAWVPEPWGARLVAEAGAKVIAEEKDLWPAKEFSLTVVVTTPEFLRDHADVVEKLLKVHHDWTRRLQQEPQKYLPQLESALLKLNGKALPAGVLPAALGRTKFTDEPLQETFHSMDEWATALGLAKPAGDLQTLFDLTILKKVRQGAGATK